MEIISIAGYTELEKLNIAKRYLIGKQREANGVKKENVQLSDNAILAIIRHYTKEAGVRNNLQTMNIPYLVKSQNEDLHDAVVFDGDKKFKADLNAYGQVVVPVDKGHGIWGVSRSCLEEAISFCQAREIVEASFKLSTPDGKRVPIQY